MARRPHRPARDVNNYVIASTGELTPPGRLYGQKVPGPGALDVRHHLQSGMRRLIGSSSAGYPSPRSGVPHAGGRRQPPVGMEQTLRGAKLEGRRRDQVEVTDEGMSRPGTSSFATARPPPPAPRLRPHAVLRLDVVDWLELVSGKTSGGELLFGGRMSIEGDETKVVSVLSHLDREHQPF